MNNPDTDKTQEIIDCLSRIIDEINARSLDVSFREQKLTLFNEHLERLRKLYKIKKFSESQVCRINQLKEISKNIKPEYTISNGEVFFKGTDGVYRRKESHMSHIPRGNAPPEIPRRSIYDTPTAIYSRTDGDNNY